MRKILCLALTVLGMGLVAAVSAAIPTTGPMPLATTRGGIAAKELTLDLGDKVTLRLVRIPAGKFVMGSPLREKGREEDETQHEVTISKPFYMGIAHVTVDQFAAFAKDSGYKTDAENAGKAWDKVTKDGKLEVIGKSLTEGRSWRNPGFDQKGDHPVVRVGWNDAKTFCNWLSERSGKMVVLPTEAQWEYACRAGTKTAYPWGDNPDDGKGWANCADQSLKMTLPDAGAPWTFFSGDDGFVNTSPVRSFKANAFGLYDMIGNEWQWCEDFYGAFDGRATTDPKGASGREFPALGGPDRWCHVLRGGSCYDGPRACRSAARFYSGPQGDLDSYGFRVAITAGVN